MGPMTSIQIVKLDTKGLKTQKLSPSSPFSDTICDSGPSLQLFRRSVGIPRSYRKHVLTDYRIIAEHAARPKGICSLQG